MVCLKLTSAPSAWTYAGLGDSLGLSASEANAAVKRALEAGLLQPPPGERGKPTPRVQALLEFLEHGVRYAFPASPGKRVRGMRTAHSAPPLNAEIADPEEPLVWADPEGEARGQEIVPLYKTAPLAARRDPGLYELLALVDAIRAGRARERELGIRLLRDRLVPPRGR